MNQNPTSVDVMPVVVDVASFDRRSGNRIERLVFNNRLLMVLLSIALSLFLGWQASKLQVNASFERMLPQSQEYVRNYLANRDSLRGLGNSVRIAVENTDGDIYDPEYLEVLRQVNDASFLLAGVDGAFMRSLWTPILRWTEVTEAGYRGGPVMPDDYDGTPQSLDKLRVNIGRAGVVGSVVANNLKSSLVFVPLLDRDADTGRPIDYAQFSQQLEQKVRALQTGKVRIRIIGFGQLMGDLIAGVTQIMGYFAVAAGIAALIVFLYTRCLRSTALMISCSCIAVLWQLGVLHLLGYALDPYSILVPFLVFAIGVSHGAQKMNGIMQDVGRGTHRYVAARYTFRRLFLAGLTALLADAVGLGVLMLIDIPVIRDLAMTASIGIGILVVTNLLLLPVLLSYIGVSPAAAARSVREEREESAGHGVVGAAFARLEHFAERRWAIAAIAVSLVLGIAGYTVSLDLKVGDLDPGAPELRADSRYNRDNQFVTDNFGLSSDVFAVILKSPAGGLGTFEGLIEVDRLDQLLLRTPGVQTTESVAGFTRTLTMGLFENNPKWSTLDRDPAILSTSLNEVSATNTLLVDRDRNAGALLAYLGDHKAETLDRVVRTVEQFAKAHNSEQLVFLLGAGSAGIEAATNIVVRDANRRMLLLVYAAVILLCFVTFRSWRAVVVAVVPLVLTSILCEALMVMLGIGVKVATLPVVALGVGIGVDYALYLLSVQLAWQRAGVPLREAYRRAVQFTGKVVALVGVTLAAGVITWALSPIKFQADMGILLTFMFLWNMVGALVLIPALSHFLLPTHRVSTDAKEAGRPLPNAPAATAPAIERLIGSKS